MPLRLCTNNNSASLLSNNTSQSHTKHKTGYAFLLAPNHLGVRHDLRQVSRLFYDNAVTFVLFNLLGLFPFILNCLMWPNLRSKGFKVGLV